MQTGPNPGRRRRLRAARLTMVAVLAATLLGACQTVPVAPIVSLAPPAEATLANSFLLSGRLSIRIGERLDTVKLVWRHDAREVRLQFFTPFGSQVAEVSQASGQAAILRQGKEVHSAESLGTLTESFLGVALDVNQIGQWVQGAGLADGVARNLEFGDGSIWSVTAERLQFAVAPATRPATRPGSVFRYATRLTAVKGDRVIRLVVDEWQPL